MREKYKTLIIVLALTLPAGLLIAVPGFYSAFTQGRLKPVCERVMKNYDSNEDGFLEPKEGIKMARALGYQKLLEFTTCQNRKILNMSRLQNLEHYQELKFLKLSETKSF
jgi:hypothetical protein